MGLRRDAKGCCMWLVVHSNVGGIGWATNDNGA
jgi:hypothetical protein